MAIRYKGDGDDELDAPLVKAAGKQVAVTAAAVGGNHARAGVTQRQRYDGEDHSAKPLGRAA
jgi:hypothetical protein